MKCHSLLAYIYFFKWILCGILFHTYIFFPIEWNFFLFQHLIFFHFFCTLLLKNVITFRFDVNTFLFNRILCSLVITGNLSPSCTYYTQHITVCFIWILLRNDCEWRNSNRCTEWRTNEQTYRNVIVCLVIETAQIHAQENSDSKTSRKYILHTPYESYLEPFRQWRSAFIQMKSQNKSCTVWNQQM